MKSLKNNLSTWIILGVILIFAFFIRTYNISSVPNGFHTDEAIIADNANFILNTGRDTNNNFFPLQTEVFGDYNPMGYAYLAVVPIKIFGLTEFAARSVGVFLGALTALGVFLLAYSIFEKIKISLLASFLMAFSPWSIILSRSTEQTASSLIFIILGFSLLIWGIKKEKATYLLLATFLLFVSYFMYFTPRFFVPLLLLTFFAPLKFWYKNRKKLFVKVFIACFIFLGTVSSILVLGVAGGANRFNQVSIFGFPETRLVMEEKIREDGGTAHMPIAITRVFHNKIVDYSYTYARNYLEYFSANFLFIKGGFPTWLSSPGTGLVYLIELPFIIYGLYLLVKKKKEWSFVLLLWLLVGPATASLTVDDIPNVRRAFVMVPVIEILAAYGFLTAIKKIPKPFRSASIGIFAIFFVFNSFYFFHQYFIHSPVHRNWYRHEGFDQVMEFVKKDYPNYEMIVVSKSFGTIYPAILFYMKYEPSKYLGEGSTKDKDGSGFGKFFFVHSECPSLDVDSRIPSVNKTIYIEDGNCKSPTTLQNKKYVYINRKDDTKAFRIVYD
ncbi:glycosyltransferase family 39 protein [Patescibacteria group bacterium]|nr:glycosyltransferase family 39 protein [Patescibacteria group bacterium]